MRSLPCLILSSTLVAAPPKPVANPAQRPKLVLFISVDQLSADLMQRYAKDLPGALGQLQRQGVYFTEAYHDHALTETGPGHAVLLSGRFPSHTGIVENDWYDRASGHKVYCVEDVGAPLLGQPGKPGVSQSRFLGTTLGDWLQAQVKGSRAFSLSGKDRAAILMAGRKPSAVYWFQGALGFNTSAAYAQATPPWLASFNEGLRERFLRDDWTWTAAAGSWNGVARTTTWNLPGGVTVRNGLPRVIQGAGMPLDKGFDDRFRPSPFFDQVTLEAAKALVINEHLGQGSSTDLFTLSLSATDYIGHHFGTGGVEMWDQIHRLDHGLGEFLAWLRKRVPGTWVVLSSDHGGMDLPVGLKDDGLPAEYLPEPKVWFANLNAALEKRLKVDANLVRSFGSPKQIYLNGAAIKAAGLDRQKVLEAIQTQLKTQPEVVASATAEALEAFPETELGSPRDSSVFARLKHSFKAERSGDVLVVFKPLTIFYDPPYLATHGSPWDYDRRVPIIFMGPWKARKAAEPVRTVDIAPTLAKALGITPSEELDGKPLELDSSPRRPAKKKD